MLTTAEVAQGVTGALKLARGDRSGLQWFDTSDRGVKRAFLAPLLVAPFYAVIMVHQFFTAVEMTGFIPYLLVKTITFVAGWAVFPVAAHELCGLAGKREGYRRLVVAYIWIGVILSFAQFPLFLLGVTGLFGDLTGFLYLLFQAAVLALVGYTVKVTLDTTLSVTLAFVSAEFVLTLMVFQYGDLLTP